MRNIADFLGEAKQAGCWCYGADAVPEAVDYMAPDYRGGVVLVLGAEGKGLRPAGRRVMRPARSGCRCAGTWTR